MAPIDARQKIEQIRRKKKSQPVNVKDLRQLIARKKKQKRGDSNPTHEGRITKTATRDLRETNKKLAARRALVQARDTRSSGGRLSQSTSRLVAPDRKSNVRVLGQSSRSIKPTRPQHVLYVPPQLQNQPATTYIIAQTPSKSNLAMDNVPEAQGASILISNLMPSITQSDIIELFGDIGVMMAVNMINQTTALVTYQNSSDAVRAVKVYHNRLLDGKPMLVNMMPNSTPTSNIRSRINLASAVDSSYNLKGVRL